jgi:hypothetical protein
MSFDEAYGLHMDCVGIVLHEKLFLLGVDFDHCVENGVITDAWVAQKVLELDSYTEYSVSGTGIHVLVWGRRPGNKCDGGKIEMYDGVGGSRFFTMSGNRVPGTPAEIRSAQGTINDLYLEVFGADDGKTAPQQNQQLNPKCYTSFHGKEGGKGKEGQKKGEKGIQKSYIQQAEKLNSDQWEKLTNLQSEKPNFKATWEKSRSARFWPFQSGRYTSSEYEMALASFLVKDGWEEQEIMDAIGVWRRKHGFKRRMETCRYALTLARAFATVTPRLKGTGSARTPVQGLYRHAETKERILGCIIETPKSPAIIAQELNLTPSHARAVLARLRKDGKVIRDRHTYLCNPTAVPWFLQNIPEAADEFTAAEMEAQYEAWVASGGADTFADLIEPVEEPIIDLDEPIEAPEMYSQAPVARHKAILPNFDELDPVAETIPGFDEPTGYFDEDGTLHVPGLAQEVVEAVVPDWTGYPEPIVHAPDTSGPYTYAMYRADMDAWEVKWKKENLERARESRKRNRERGLPSMAQMKRDARQKKLIARRERDLAYKRQSLIDRGILEQV